jgi:TetR/AcrR family transcriptional regulator, repressor for uid operon
MRKVDPVRHEEKRREILDAAARCFERRGLGGASIADICAEANISPGHLYHYFASKEAIIGAMTAIGLERATQRFRDIMNSSDAVEALLAELGRLKSPALSSKHALIIDMLAEAGRNPEIGKIVQDHSRNLHVLLARFVREGQAQGQIDQSLDVDLAAALLLGVLDGARTLAIRDPQLDKAAATEMLRTLINRFLRPPAR